MTCSSCGRSNPEGARFCAFCGTPLAPSQLAGGERKYATVLFADVAGSTALSERLDPEDWAEIMNGAFAFMNASVTSYGGTVGRLMGDAVLAFFGAPSALEDHAIRAVHAALAIQAAAERYAVTLQAQYDILFRMRVGIATGHVVYASVGDSAKAEFTAMGDTANVAARLQGLANAGNILVDAETESLVRRAFELDALDPALLKGKSEAVAVYRVVGIRPHVERSVLDVGAPLVGRERELATLVDRVRSGTEGSGNVVLLVGEAGVGKSRLLSEVRHRLDFDASIPRWIEGRALSYGQAASYHPWRSAVRALVGLEDLPTEEAPTEAEYASLSDALQEWSVPHQHVDVLARLAGIETTEGAEAAHQPTASAEVVETIAAATRALLQGAATADPFVLVLEDLHWADGASIDLLVSVADVVRSAPLTIIAAMRPERASSAWRVKARLPSALGAAFGELDLAPLGPADADAMLALLPAAAALPDATRARIIGKSDGNPYFLEEIIRDLIDSGRLILEGERWRATGDIDEVDIPDTLMGVLTARIDRLPERTKHVAQTAAVIGRTFSTPVLAGVYAAAPLGERIDDVAPHLGALAREELVRELDAQTRRTYRFKHALSQEAAYAGLLLRRRRELHRRTLDVLEGIYRDASDVHAAELAYHAMRAEDWARAASYSSVAGERAMQVYAVNEALEHHTNALEAIERIPEADPERTIRAALAWVDVSVRTLRHEQPGPRQAMLERLERVEGLARQLGHQNLLARVLVHKGNVLALSGFPETAYPSLEEASGIALDLDDEPLFLLPFYYATERMVDLDPRKAAAQFQQIIELAQRYGNRGFEAHAHAVRAMALARLGEREEALREVGIALQMGPESGSRIKEADVNIIAGLVFLELGETDRAVALSELGAQQALDAGGMECACGGYFVHGMTQLSIERLPEASTSFRTSAKLGASLEMQSYVNLAVAGDAYTRLEAGDPTAVVDLEKALVHARELRDAYGAAMLSRMLGEHYLEHADHVRAAELFREAVGYYEAAGMGPDLVRVAPTAALALERSGDAAGARALLERVERMEQGARA